MTEVKQAVVVYHLSCLDNNLGEPQTRFVPPSLCCVLAVTLAHGLTRFLRYPRSCRCTAVADPSGHPLLPERRDEGGGRGQLRHRVVVVLLNRCWPRFFLALLGTPLTALKFRGGGDLNNRGLLIWPQ